MGWPELSLAFWMHKGSDWAVPPSYAPRSTPGMLPKHSDPPRLSPSSRRGKHRVCDPVDAIKGAPLSSLPCCATEDHNGGCFPLTVSPRRHGQLYELLFHSWLSLLFCSSV